MIDVGRIERLLGEKADSEKAEIVRRYMKSKLDFYGVAIPELRKLARDAVRESGAEKAGDVYDDFWELWKSGNFEERHVGLFVLERLKRTFDGETWEVMEKLVDDMDNWAECDASCSIRSVMVDEERLKELKKWAHSPNLWKRRSAAVTLILPIRHGEVTAGQVFGIVEPMMEDGEYFVQKGVGWALKDLSPMAVDEVVEFLKKWKDRSARTLIQVAVEKMPPAEKRLFIKKRGQARRAAPVS